LHETGHAPINTCPSINEQSVLIRSEMPEKKQLYSLYRWLSTQRANFRGGTKLKETTLLKREEAVLLRTRAVFLRRRTAPQSEPLWNAWQNKSQSVAHCRGSWLGVRTSSNEEARQRHLTSELKEEASDGSCVSPANYFRTLLFVAGFTFAGSGARLAGVGLPSGSRQPACSPTMKSAHSPHCGAFSFSIAYPHAAAVCASRITQAVVRTFQRSKVAV